MDTDDNAFERVAPHQWIQLPEQIVEKIFGYLDIRDRCSVMQVSDKWAEILMSPHFWRRVVLRFPHLKLVPQQGDQQQKYTPLNLVERFGVFMKEVKISYRRPRFIDRNRLQKEISPVMELLRETAKLTSFTMQRLTLHHIWMADGAREKLIESVSALLRSQPRLKMLDLSYSNCSMDEVKLLYGGMLRWKSCPSMEEINLRCFSSPGLRWTSNLFEILRMCPNLKKLSVDGSEMTNCLAEVIYIWCRQLEKLNVSFRKNESFPTISTSKWIYMDIYCKKLQVSIEYDRVHHIEFIQRTLVADIPLEELSFSLERCTQSFTQDLADHLYKFRYRLSRINLDFTSGFSDTIPPLLNIVATTLHNLSTVFVRASLPQGTWKEFLMKLAQRENTREVKLVCILDSKINDFGKLESLFQWCAYVFSAKGIVFRYSIETTDKTE